MKTLKKLIKFLEVGGGLSRSQKDGLLLTCLGLLAEALGWIPTYFLIKNDPNADIVSSVVLGPLVAFICGVGIICIGCVLISFIEYICEIISAAIETWRNLDEDTKKDS